MNDSNTYITEIFSNPKDAEDAFVYALKCGYTDQEINILMSEESKKKYYDSVLTNIPEDVSKGGVLGGTIGGVIGALIVLGTNLVMPGLGLIVAGPLAGVVAGTLMGTLLALGISETNAQEYSEEIKSGAIILSVKERISCDLKDKWQQIKKNKN